MATKKTKTLSAEQLLSGTHRALEPFELPRSGGVVYLREASGKDAADLYDPDENDARSAAERGYDVLIRNICDEDGNPIFTADQNDEVRAAFGTKTLLDMQQKLLEVSGVAGAANELSVEQVKEAMKQAGIAEDRAAVVLKLCGVDETETAEEAAKND